MTDIGYTLSAPSVRLIACSQIPPPAVSRHGMKLLLKVGALKPQAFEDSVPKQEFIRYSLDPIKSLVDLNH